MGSSKSPRLRITWYARERRADPAAAVKVTNGHTTKLADQVEIEISTGDPDFNISGISKVRGSQENTAVPDNTEISKSGDSQGYMAVPDTTSVKLGNQEKAPTTEATTLAALTDTGRKRYLTRSISDATAKERAEFKQSFDEIQKKSATGIGNQHTTSGATRNAQVDLPVRVLHLVIQFFFFLDAPRRHQCERGVGLRVGALFALVVGGGWISCVTRPPSATTATTATTAGMVANSMVANSINFAQIVMPLTTL